MASTHKIAKPFLSFPFEWLANNASLRPKLVCPAMFTIDGHDFTDLQFGVLPYFKGFDIILGLSALKKLEVAIHPNMNSFTMGDYTVQCDRESRRISCLMVDTDKMNQTIVK